MTRSPQRTRKGSARGRGRRSGTEPVLEVHREGGLAPGRRGNAPFARRRAVQKRSAERFERILDVTAGLIAELGLEGVNTVVIARRAGISVGSLYHYFPNYHAILHALASRWLERMRDTFRVLDESGHLRRSFGRQLDLLTERGAEGYRDFRRLASLIRAMEVVPELAALEREHTERQVETIVSMLRGYGATQPRSHLARVARVAIEINHYVPLRALTRGAPDFDSWTEDLKRLNRALFSAFVPLSAKPRR